MTINQRFGENVNRILKEIGMEKQELAQELSFSKQYISMILNGSRTVSAEIIKRTAEVLQVKPAELIANHDVKSEDDIKVYLSGSANSRAAKNTIKKAKILFQNYINLVEHDEKNEMGISDKYDERV